MDLIGESNTMSNFTKSIQVSVTPAKKEEIEKKVKEGPYTSEAAYGRAMIEAGESRIAALDPRTNSNEGDTITETDSVEEVARALTDTVLVEQLSDEPQNIQEILEEPTHEFQSILANRLDELAADEASKVERDPLEEGYYLDTGGV